MVEKESQKARGSLLEKPPQKPSANSPYKSLPINRSAVENDPVAIKNVSESILRALSYFGSKEVVVSLLQILEQDHSFTLRDILRNPGGFRAGVEIMFGEGSYVVDRVVRMQLARDLNINYEGIGLEELISIYKARLEAKEI